MTARQEPARPVSAEERDKFERDGYLVIDLPDESTALLDAIVADLGHKFEGEERYEGKVFFSPRRIMDAWRINDSVKSLALDAEVLGVLHELYGRKPLPFQTLNFQRGSEQPPHSDTIHFNSIPPGYMCGVWVALEDIDEDNGPLVYYPGSHRSAEITMSDVGVQTELDQYPHYERYVADLIVRERLRPEHATINKGQALIWSSNLLHGGAPQTDAQRTRYSQVTHYFFDGCKYYTPMLSGEDETYWREPEWITFEEPDSSYLGPIRRAVSETVPESRIVVVASDGDDRLLDLDGRQGWHFPQDPGGGYAGHYPVDSAAAIEHLEELRTKGGEYFLLPHWALWWLDHYAEFGEHLRGRYSRLPTDEGACVIYALD